MKSKEKLEVSIEQGNDSKAAGRDFNEIETQNNFYSSVKFKILKIKKNNSVVIKAHKIIFNSVSLYSSLISSFILCAVLPFLFSYYFDFSFSFITNIPLLDYFIFSIFLFLVFFSSSVLAIFLSHITSSTKVTLYKNKIVVDKKIIKYKNIRGVLKSVDKIGYSVYIYNLKKVHPFISFNLSNIHDANAIHELITYNIKNEKDKK